MRLWSFAIFALAVMVACGDDDVSSEWENAATQYSPPVLANGDLASAYEQFQRYIGMLTAGLGALFFMGIFMKRVNGFGAVCGLAANYAVTFGLDLLPWSGKPHMLLYGFFGMIVCIVVAMLASPFGREGRI